LFYYILIHDIWQRNGLVVDLLSKQSQTVLSSNEVDLLRYST